MKAFTVAGQTEVLIDKGLPHDLLPDRRGRSKVAVLFQPATATVVEAVVDSFHDQGLFVETVELPDREEAKTLSVSEAVYKKLAAADISRHDTVVGVGGGSVTDLAGFIAGTWLRGVESVYVPTTLLGAVDASIGGKTGINLAGKNLVGVFWHPSRVVIDLNTLGGLPAPIQREGMAEIIKAGLIGDAALFEAIESEGLETPIEELVTRSIAVKVDVVNDDEREFGRRAYLNLGHTIGHGIEFASGLSHGEAVALGLVAAARISEEKLGFVDAERITDVLGTIGLPVEVVDLDPERVLELMQRDKKRDAQGLRMVLLEDVGRPVLHHVDEAIVNLGLEAIGLATS
jgi:3-dehydroquinate synthase